MTARSAPPTPHPPLLYFQILHPLILHGGVWCLLLSSAEAFNAPVGAERYLHWYEAQTDVGTDHEMKLQTCWAITSRDALS